ncbi:ROK family transcriptional regulator [Sinomonas atrocyanea]|nr:ROK family transcriptional regulator [Sinomonas atrocyanea]
MGMEAAGRLAFHLPAVKDPHRAELFSLVLRNEPLTRADLAELASLDQSTVTRTLKPLIDSGYVTESPAAPAGRGRPRRVIRVAVEKLCAVGIKIGPHAISGVLTDLGAKVIARQETAVDRPGPEEALAAVAELVGSLLDAVPGSRERALGIGVGVSGHVDPPTGTCRFSPILGWHDVDIATPLGRAAGLPVSVHNDVNTLAVAEYLFGAGREAEDFAVVTLGPGIGLGLVIGGRLHDGAEGLAGEFGHIPLLPEGPQCHCGRRGCLEALAGDDAIARAAGMPSVAAAADLARSGEGTAQRSARRAFRGAGEWIGRGLAVIDNILAPELILLSGEGIAAYDLLSEGIASGLGSCAFEGARALERLRIDSADVNLWARGAACLAIQRSLG